MQQQLDDFLLQFDGLMLSTVSAESVPEASYAPFVRLDGRWYIFVSLLARHTKNLQANPSASILLVESLPSVEAFARRRLSLQMQCRFVSRETSVWQQVMSIFTASFGDVVSVLTSLPDFNLVEMSPVSGQFIAGFAKAYQLSGDDMLQIGKRRTVKDESADA